MTIVANVLRTLGFEYDDESSNSDGDHKETPNAAEELHKDDRPTLAAEEKFYVTMDGDDVGGEVEESLMQDTTEVAEELSAAIRRSHDQIHRVVTELEGRVVFDGGDNLMAIVPASKVNELATKAKEIYKKETDHSITIGIGKSPMQAHYALVYGKNTGKNKIVTYDTKIAEEVKKIKEKQKALEETYKSLKYRASKEASKQDEALEWLRKTLVEAGEEGIRFDDLFERARASNLPYDAIMDVYTSWLELGRIYETEDRAIMKGAALVDEELIAAGKEGALKAFASEEAVHVAGKKVSYLSDKVMKKMVPLFVDKDKPDDHKCGSCFMRLAPNQCTVVEGAINFGQGVCSFWAEGNEAKVEDSKPEKMSYVTSGYVESPSIEFKINCETCQHYQTQEKDGFCKLWAAKVKPGQCCMAYDNLQVKTPGAKTAAPRTAPPEPITEPTNTAGWLAINGKLYPLEDAGTHSEAAKMYFGSTYEKLLDNAWIRYSEEGAEIRNWNKVTEPQWQYLEDALFSRDAMIFDVAGHTLPVESSDLTESGHNLKEFLRRNWRNVPITSSKKARVLVAYLKQAHCGPCTPLKMESIKMLSDIAFKDAASVDKAKLGRLAEVSSQKDVKPFVDQLQTMIAEVSPGKFASEITKLTQIQKELVHIQEHLDKGELQIIDKEGSYKTEINACTCLCGELHDNTIPCPKLFATDVRIKADETLIWALGGSNNCAQCISNVGRTPEETSDQIPLHENCHCQWVPANLTESNLKQANDPIKKNVTVNDLPIAIEWPKGSTRKYKDGYSQVMSADYGYLRRTEGADGEELDIYVGPSKDSKLVVKIEQLKKDGSYDEDKYVLGTNSTDEAVNLYLQHMPEDRLGKVTTMAWDQFEKMVKKEQAETKGAAAILDASRHFQKGDKVKLEPAWIEMLEETGAHDSDVVFEELSKATEEEFDQPTELEFEVEGVTDIEVPTAKPSNFPVYAPAVIINGHPYDERIFRKAEKKEGTLKTAQPRFELVDLVQKNEGRYSAELRIPRSSTRHHDTRNLNKFLQVWVKEKGVDIADAVAEKLRGNVQLEIDADQTEFFPDVADEWVTFEVKIQSLIQDSEIGKETESSAQEWRPWPHRAEKTLVSGRFNVQANKIELKVGSNDWASFDGFLIATASLKDVTDDLSAIVFVDETVQAAGDLVEAALEKKSVEKPVVEADQGMRGVSVGSVLWTQKVIQEAENYYSKLGVVPDRENFIQYILHAANEETPVDISYEQAEQYYNEWAKIAGNKKEAEIPPKPTEPPPEGTTWVWDNSSQAWIAVTKSI